MKRLVILLPLVAVQPAHAQHDHSGHGHTAQPAPPPVATAAHPPQAPKTPLPVLTDADRAAAFPVLEQSHDHRPPVVTLISIDRLEGWENGQGWEAVSWTGTDVHRLWLRTEGEVERDRLHSAHLEVLYGRAHGPWWDVVAGIRHDFKTDDGRSRTWAALGVQGLAPYKFETALTAYVSDDGQSRFAAEAEYDLLLTNNLVVQPSLELSAFGKNDPERGEGSGLSTLEAGLRLKYRLTRQFAPYVGVSREHSFGKTADYRRTHHQPVADTRWVAGVSLWF